jgi:Fe-S-cluster containining protein
VTTIRIRREHLKPGEILCSYCTAKCCRYFALAIDTPTTWNDFDHMRWYMMHGPVSIFVEDGTWYLMIHHDCQHLQADNLCGIYHDRPRICRSYSTRNCEYDEDACYEKLFETPDQLWEYAEAVMPPRRRKRSNLQVQLPVLSGTG